MATPDSIPHPLKVELLNSERCLKVAHEIAQFEDSIFGNDFACPSDSFGRWVESGCLFYSAVGAEALAHRVRILAVVSLLITSTQSRDRLIRGEIRDGELTPYSACPLGETPCLYFASVISDNPSHLAKLYESLAQDVESFLIQRKWEPSEAFAVAVGESGFRHMARSGFRAIEGRKYLGSYDLMQLDFVSARTPLWQRLLQPARLRDRLSPPTSEWESGGEPALDAHEVERRLTQSKTERYRLKSY